MRLRHIEIFHAVFVTGSVNGAARALNVSQPTVSKVLKHAEDQLGFQLFEREKGRLSPTDRGITLFAKIEPLFDDLNALDRFTKHLATSREGHLRIGMTPAFGLEVVPRAISKFIQTNPDVKVEAETLHAVELTKAIMSEELDMGLVFDAPSYPGLSSTHIGDTEFVCVTPTSFKGLPNRELKFEDLKDQALIGLSQKSVLGQTLERKFNDAFGGSYDAQVVVETYHLAKSLVRQKAGVAVIDAITALSGDLSGIKLRRFENPLPIRVDVVQKLGKPQARFKLDFITELQAAVTIFKEQ